MSFFRDDPRTTTVRWFFVAQGTPYVPYPTPFTSGNWDTDHYGYDGLGEVWDAPRTYRKGQRVGDGSGVRPCGTADQWLNGQDLPVPVPRDVYGTPTCCTVLPSPFVHYDCVACPRGAWDVYFLGVFGLPTAVFARGNGIWALRYLGGCTWESESWETLLPPPNPAFATWRLYRINTQTIITAYAPTLGIGWNWQDFVWDCLAPHTFPVNNPASLPAGEPLTVMVWPGDTAMQTVGVLALYAGNVLPANYLPANGAAVSRVTFAQLFSAIGTTYGAGDGVHTFNLPNAASLPSLGGATWCVVAASA